MDCQFQPSGMVYSCQYCGTVKRQPTRRNCPVGGGLGDAVAAFTSRFGIKPCGGCKKRQRWLNSVIPWRERPDVVLFFPRGADPDWMETRGELVGRLLEKNGKTAYLVQPETKDAGALLEVVKTLKPRLLVNRAFFIDQAHIRTVAKQYPGTRFVTVNHSSYAYTQANDRWVREQAHAIKLAAELPNVFLAHVDERAIMGRLGLKRCIYLPNVVTPPDDQQGPAVDPQQGMVSVTGRWHMVKNQLQQLMAVKLAGQRALLVMKGRENLQEMTAAAIGLDFELLPWQSWRSWHQVIHQRVVVGMQASFSESFNYVALEHMQQGRPVVGSPAVRYLPDSWQANPDSPADMALILRRHLADYPGASERARAVAGKVAERNNSTFLEVIDRLLSSKSAF